MWIAVFATIICSLLMVSIFCWLMKKKDTKRLASLQQGASGVHRETKFSSKSSLKSRMMFGLVTAVGDFVFLMFKIVGYVPCHMVRMLFYKYVFHMDIAENVVIYYGLEARYPWNIKIGRGSIIGDHAILDARFGIEIGENVNLSTGVWMWTLQHDVHSPTFGIEGEGKRIRIGDRAWISSRSTILPGCTVEEGCVVAASAVVTKSCSEPFGIYGGVPAKKIGVRNQNLIYVFDGGHRRFL